MEEELIKSLCFSVKEKKELSGLANSIVEEAIKSYFSKNNIKKSNFSEKEKKLVIKEVRSNLRRLSGRFQNTSSLQQELLESGKIEDLLKTHSSAEERIADYPFLKGKISPLHIKSILDLGCGLNPIALASKGIKYYATDINQNDLDLVKEYFNMNNISGEAFLYDLRNLNSPLPKADLCLILKVFDVLEERGHKLAEKIIKFIQCKYLLVSFSTKTLSGKPMNHPQRGWIEQLLKRLNYSYESFKTKNEIFYLIKKLDFE
ncbi:MAG: hypothetical protein Q7R87_04020 [Nanoarchaeota archaeon]|nr:hypothetical protein [Nanoarchaeota archaeon]